MTKTNTTLKCSSSNTKAIRNASKLPEKLFKVHGDKIQLRDSAIYQGNKKPIDVACNVCQHEWSPMPMNILKGKGCHKCNRVKQANSVGKKRSRRANTEERDRAVKMRTKGMSYEAIGKGFGRSTSTVIRWLNPDSAEKNRKATKVWRDENIELSRLNSRRYQNFEHGKKTQRKAKSKRRGLEWEALFPVLIEGEFNEVDMYSYLETWEDKTRFVDEQSCQDYAMLMATAKEMKEQHGEEFHVDHLIPLSRGGLHHTDNFKIVPASYNLSKNNKRIKEDEELFCKRLFNIK